MMVLGIDASNIRGGGGVTHLVELLGAAKPQASGFQRVIVWGSQATIDRIADKEWLDKRSHPWLERNLFWRSCWQYKWLSKLASSEGCDSLFVPGGSYVGNFHSVITMSQNLLPFELGELRRFGFSWMSIKLYLLRLIQTVSFRRSDGLIFLTYYAEGVVRGVIGRSRAKTIVIAHGLAVRFLAQSPSRLLRDVFTIKKPFRLLYVSIIDAYKHQDNVAIAVGRLHERGVPISLDLVGPSYGPALRKLKYVMKQVNRLAEIVRYHGPVGYEQLHECYAQADGIVFASSCENLPIILLEGMAAGLPIACSDRGPMPEILGDAGVYFNPESVDSIAAALQILVADNNLRHNLAQKASRRVAGFSWEKCAAQTFDFLAHTAQLKQSSIQMECVAGIKKL